MEGLFPGTFNITEEELESLIGESGSGSTFGGIEG